MLQISLPRLSALLVLSLCFTVTLRAEDKPAKIVVDDPAAVTDEDFKYQGEYAGQILTDDGVKSIGAQVVARGEGKFFTVAYIGGLPGAGWDNSERRTADGELKDGVIKVSGKRIDAHIDGESVTVFDKNGFELGKLKRVKRESPTLGAKPPEGAVVMFDGSSADAFDGGMLTMDKLLKQGVTSKQKFSDCTLHLEFRLPYQPQDRDQGRGNSGCYLQGRWEVQILDSFGLEGKQNECGGLYSVKDCDLNMCLPPLVWQTYDIDFTAARYDNDKLTKNARITVKHNGVVIHKDVELPDRTSTAAPVEVGPAPGPVYLQDHGNPLRFRNIWIKENAS